MPPKQAPGSPPKVRRPGFPARAGGETSEAAIVMKKLLATYKQKCKEGGGDPGQELIKAMEKQLDGENIMNKFIIRPIPPKDEIPVKETKQRPLSGGIPRALRVRKPTVFIPPVRAVAALTPQAEKILKDEKNSTLRPCYGRPVMLEHLVDALLTVKYNGVRELHIWDLCLTQKALTILGEYLHKSYCHIQVLELINCILSASGLSMFGNSVNSCRNLTALILDHTEIGDTFCQVLCDGLMNNGTLLVLSLNYCSLCMSCGAVLGQLIGNSSIREVYLNGNNLECEGAMQLIQMCVEQAEEEAEKRKESLRLFAEEEARKAILAREGVPYGGTAVSKDRPYSTATLSSKGGRKKKRKGKKGQDGGAPPTPIGPWLSRLQLVDNGIDSNGEGSFVAPIILMRLFRKLISFSEELEELDLRYNLIGDLGGKEVVEGLKIRNRENLPGMDVYVTHQMNPDTFAAILRLSGQKKKGKGKKK